MNDVADLMILAGIFLLIGSLFIIRRLVLELPPGHLRRWWCVLWVLNAVFAAGYACFLLDEARHIGGLSGFVVSSVYFLGANFVVLVSFLSLETAKGIKRLALLEQETVTDPLTGLYNRRYLERELANEFKRAKRYRRPLSVLMLDVDHFKKVNDEYGHRVGDKVLAALADILKANVREADVVARYGGEEIVVIATETPAKGAADLAERLRKAVARSALVTLEDVEKSSIHATVSIGVADADSRMGDADSLIRAADTAMYLAKSAGRNQVAVRDAGEWNGGFPAPGLA